jgi:hypothetical protein
MTRLLAVLAVLVILAVAAFAIFVVISIGFTAIMILDSGEPKKG